MSLSLRLSVRHFMESKRMSKLEELEREWSKHLIALKLRMEACLKDGRVVTRRPLLRYLKKMRSRVVPKNVEILLSEEYK